MWYSLDKKSKMNRQGVLKVRVAFGTEKNNQVAEQEYRHMLRIVLLHELELSQVGIIFILFFLTIYLGRIKIKQLSSIFN